MFNCNKNLSHLKKKGHCHGNGMLKKFINQTNILKRTWDEIAHYFMHVNSISYSLKLIEIKRKDIHWYRLHVIKSYFSNSVIILHNKLQDQQLQQKVLSENQIISLFISIFTITISYIYKFIHTCKVWSRAEYSAACAFFTIWAAAFRATDTALRRWSIATVLTCHGNWIPILIYAISA